jgi:hypothetical protein
LPRDAPVPMQRSRIVQTLNVPKRFSEVGSPGGAFPFAKIPWNSLVSRVCKFPTKPYAQRIAPVSWHFRTDAALPLPHNATSTDPRIFDPLPHCTLTPLFFTRLRDRPREAFMAFPLLISFSIRTCTHLSLPSEGGGHADSETTPELSRHEQDSP